MKKHPYWYYKYYDHIFGYRRNYNNEILQICNISELREKSIQEIGAGSGNHAIRILERNPKYLELLDSDSIAIGILEDRFSSNSFVRISNRDGFNPSFQNQFDIIICMFSIILLSIENLSELENRISLLIRRLNPSGYLFFEFVDYDVCKNLYYDCPKKTIYNDGKNEVYIKSEYTDNSLKFFYSGLLEGSQISYNVELLRINKLTIDTILTSFDVSCYGFKPLDEFERRILAYVRK